MALSARGEAEVAELDAGDRSALLADLGLAESARTVSSGRATGCST
jgi:hypothetical protein